MILVLADSLLLAQVAREVGVDHITARRLLSRLAHRTDAEQFGRICLAARQFDETAAARRGRQ